MVVLPIPSPAGTGFGDAVIVAVDAAGLPVGTLAFFEESHAAKKISCKRIVVVRMSCFIAKNLTQRALAFSKNIAQAVNRNR
jgi:hypothetical protein